MAHSCMSTSNPLSKSSYITAKKFDADLFALTNAALAHCQL